MELSNYNEEILDEILEILWIKLEEGGQESVPRGEIVIGTIPVDDEAIGILVDKGYLVVTGDAVQLTDPGFEEARHTIRRHRLSERMFYDIFDVAEEEMEEVACRFE